jgi:hypothetical protein
MRLILLLALLIAFPANAEPIARMEGADFSITLHKSPCKLTGEITNLKRRAVWVEKGKSVEGCWGISQQLSLVMMYFADKTATAIPAQQFAAVTGA